MPVSFQKLLQSGGHEQLQLLRYFVRSTNVDQLFLFLARDYKLMPAATKGIALYEVFLHPQTVARISSDRLLPHKDMRLANEIEKLSKAYLEHQNWHPASAGAAEVSDHASTGGDEQQAHDTSAPEQKAGDDHVADDQLAEDARAEDARPPVPMPANYLFDAVITDLQLVTAETLSKLEQSYDSEKGPTENLPGGAMTAAQQQFVDQVWVPKIRPYLVSAGFRRVASVA